jgi:polysaccharide pyruvyl transferase WcaK-like protein
MMQSITLLGSSSGRNAGDAALISGIMESVDRGLGRSLVYEIPTIKPGFVRSSYPHRVAPISMLPWSGSLKMLGLPTYRSIMRTDLSLIFDAILFDRQLFNPLFNFLSTLSLILPAAKKRGKKLGFFNVGAGPVTTPRGRDMLRRLADLMDFITVRDQSSYNILMDIGVANPRVLVTADAALNVTPAPAERVDAILRAHGLTPGEEILAINMSKYLDTWAGGGRAPMGKERFLEVYGAALDIVAAKLDVPILFVCTQHHDIDVTRELMERVRGAKRKAIVTNREYSHYEIHGILGRVSLLFGMRLHATILASSLFTPVLALPHQPKVAHYFKTLGLDDYVLTFESFNVPTVADHILKGWAERTRIRHLLDQHIPPSKKRALKASELVGAIDRGEDLDGAITRLKNDEVLSAVQVG